MTDPDRLLLFNQINHEMRRSLEKTLRALSIKHGDTQLQVGFDNNPHPLTYLYCKRLLDTGDKKLIPEFLSTLRFSGERATFVKVYNSHVYLNREWEAIAKCFSTESSFPKILEGPSLDQKVRAGEFLDWLLELLGNLSPTHFYLINKITPTVILAKPHVPWLRSKNFGGASSPYFWGGVIINSRLLGSKHAFLEQLLHESLHMLLFGLCNIYGELCTNSDTELYPSAYRPDPRPMNGLIHAYFVAKNLAHCFSFLPQEFKGRLETALVAAERLEKEISNSAKLTPFGELILNSPEITNLDA